MKKTVALTLVMGSLAAAPAGFNAVHGTAVLSQKGSDIKITSGKSAIIHWDDFSISKGERVYFLQQDAKSKVLNRVAGHKLSRIDGKLESNGQVYLINPAGIYIGKDAKVVCAAFIASTMDVEKEAFLSDKPLSIRENLGSSIQHEGMIEATALKHEGGRVLLVAQKVEVDGKAKGDTIHILGDFISIKDNAYIDACVPMGAGEILIGGDQQGQNPAIYNAKQTHIYKGAKVIADALDCGDGGRIIYWSDGETIACGTSSARGGPHGGNGGFIEASGKEKITYRGKSDRRAPLGKVGELLIDPESNITIDGGAVSSGGSFVGGVWVPGADTGTIPIGTVGSAGTLIDELSMGDVTINTAFAGVSANPGAVTVGNTDPIGEPFTWGGNDANLTINAAGNVTLGRDITNTGQGTFAITTESNITLSSTFTLSSPSGPVVFNANQQEPATTGSFVGIQINGALETSDADILLNGRGGTTGTRFGVRTGAAGSIIASGSGNISINARSSSGALQFLDGSVIRSNSGQINCVGVGNFDGGNISGIIESTSGAINVTGTGEDDGLNFTSTSVITSTSGDITLNGQGSTTAFGSSLHAGCDVNGTITSISGDVFIQGFGGVGVSFCNGIVFGGTITNTDGDVSMIGRASEFTTGSSNNGITGSGDITSTNGLISLTGFGGAGTTFNLGLNLSGTIANENGNILLTGENPFDQGGICRGIALNTACVISNIDGDIIGSAKTLSAAGVCTGIFHLGTMDITGAGNIQFTATGGAGSGGLKLGFETGADSITRTNSGNIDITGIGGPGTGGSEGIRLFGQVATTSGAMTFNGEATGDSSGVRVISTMDPAISTTSGPITITGIASDGDDNIGVDFNATNANTILSDSGSIRVTGTGGNSGSGCHGVRLTNGGINTTDGSVTFIGTGGQGTTDNSGVVIESMGAAITSSGAGSIHLTGVAGGLTQDSHGIQISNSALITQSGTGQIAMSGTGPLQGTQSFGVLIENAPTIISGRGAAHLLRGIALANNDGVLIDMSTIDITDNGQLLIRAESDITIQSGASIAVAGNAQIIANDNLSILSAASVTAGNNLDLVCDQAFPDIPNFGASQMNIEASATITSGGELRLYTVRPSQNQLNSPLNGQIFTPGPFLVDTATETYLTYYRNGSFGGPNFNIYYKIGQNFLTIFQGQVALSQLENLLPVIQLLPFNSNCRVSNYHGGFSISGLFNIDPAFEPYSSFIFENTVFWISPR